MNEFAECFRPADEKYCGSVDSFCIENLVVLISGLVFLSCFIASITVL